MVFGVFFHSLHCVFPFLLSVLASDFHTRASSTADTQPWSTQELCKPWLSTWLCVSITSEALKPTRMPGPHLERLISPAGTLLFVFLEAPGMILLYRGENHC